MKTGTRLKGWRYYARYARACRASRALVPNDRPFVGLFKSHLLRMFLENVGISRQKWTKTNKRLQERVWDTPTKGFSWLRLSPWSKEYAIHYVA